MVQGPQDLESMNIVPRTTIPGNTVQEAARRQKPATHTDQAATFTQAADTVHLSAQAVHASGRAHAPAPTLPTPAVSGAGTAQGAPPVNQGPRPAVAQGFGPAPAGPVTPQRVAALAALPEVAPDRVRAGANALQGLTGQSGALNAKLAEKLLTES